MIDNPYKSVVDINSTFKRTGRYPLDQDSLFTYYSDVSNQIKDENSNFYNGQILSVLFGNQEDSILHKDDNSAVPYIVQYGLDETENLSYSLERIVTVSYIDSIFEDQGFAKRIEIGYNLTGVGRWYDYQLNELGTAYYTKTFAEIFNDYQNNEALSNFSHAEGSNNKIDENSDSSHVEGSDNELRNAPYTHVEGVGNRVSGTGSHVEGSGNIVNSNYSHVGGERNTTQSIGANRSDGSFIHGSGNLATKEYSTIFGENNSSFATYTFVQGANNTDVTGDYSHVEGSNNSVSGAFAHAEGYGNEISGAYGHAEGSMTTVDSAYGHAEGWKTTVSGTYAHAEGYNTSALVDYSHAEGDSTIAWAVGAHAEGAHTNASGPWSHATGYGTNAEGPYSNTSGYYTETLNEYESTFGRYSRSYDGTEGRLLKYCDIEMTESGKSIFTIGDGNQEDTPDYTYRHNIIAVHENGDSIKASGKSYFVDEVYAPVSYSYVESLGITAYLTTVLSALLENPKYQPPTVGMKVTGVNSSNYYTSSASATIQYGNTINQTIGFRATYVVPNYNDQDPKYGTLLGNRLGYSTAITEITYVLNGGEEQNGTINWQAGTYLPGSGQGPLVTNNIGDRVTATYSGLSYTKELLKYPKDDLGLFCGRMISSWNASNENLTFAAESGGTTVYASHVYGDSANIAINTSFKPLWEGNHVLGYLTSYSFTGPSQMYFQQLANKMTYVPNDGLAPTNKFGQLDQILSYTSMNQALLSVNVQHYYYFGTTNDTITPSFKFSSNATTFNMVECKPNTVHNINTEYAKTLSASGSPKTFWVAIPADGPGSSTISDQYCNVSGSYRYMNGTIEEDGFKGEVNLTDAEIKQWAQDNDIRCVARLIKTNYPVYDSYVTAQTSAATGVLDTGFEASQSMAIRKIRTNYTVNNTGLYYDIYYINGSASIPTGTISFRIKRIW